MQSRAIFRKEYNSDHNNKKTTHRLLSFKELTFEQEEISGRLLYQEADFYW